MAKKLRFLIPIILIMGVAGYFLLQNRQIENFVARTKFQVREAVEPIVKPKATLPPSPTAKVLAGGYQTFQTFNNCGPASLSMTLRYFGISVSQHTLGDQLRPYQVASGDNDDKSTTLPEMAKKAESYGLLAYHRPNGNIELIKQFISAGIPIITRTWTKVNEDIGHFRVIKGYDDAKGVIIQDDSLQGENLEFSYDEFNILWSKFNYEYLVLTRADQKDLAETILGKNLIESIAWENAAALSNAEVAKNPQNIDAIFNRSVAYYHLAKYKEAAADFEKVELSLPFRTLWYQIEPILTYQKLKNYDRVLLITQRVIDKGNRAFSEAYQIRGEVYQEQEKTDKAQTEFEKVLIYNKNFYKYWD
ncbi:hypothetical protein A2125_00170 [Candidatus Woesebacteria bacterium GWB1_43_5]|uniref:Peptidase C39 domain-containing protein n=1 Tax=Candidatus Woesebacteria bacterium GWB1_43_5 TaxID=1802474 RepID=A0A1F7WSC0_9BACT|nr:MAG: hypothetical protein A2125_00170 [Candidatus Woesebacteria bacterium GWB1_43_5]